MSLYRNNKKKLSTSLLLQKDKNPKQILLKKQQQQQKTFNSEVKLEDGKYVSQSKNPNKKESNGRRHPKFET